MRQFFLIIVLLAVVTAFFRSDLADDLFVGRNYSLTNWFNQVSDSAEVKVIKKFKADAMPIMMGLSEQQVEYAEHVMKDRETLGVFFLRYCKGKDVNPYIYGVSLMEFCNLIGDAGILK